MDQLAGSDESHQIEQPQSTLSRSMVNAPLPAEILGLSAIGVGLTESVLSNRWESPSVIVLAGIGVFLVVRIMTRALLSNNQSAS
jgi:hypothetical protein